MKCTSSCRWTNGKPKFDSVRLNSIKWMNMLPLLNAQRESATQSTSDSCGAINPHISLHFLALVAAQYTHARFIWDVLLISYRVRFKGAHRIRVSEQDGAWCDETTSVMNGQPSVQREDVDCIRMCGRGHIQSKSAGVNVIDKLTGLIWRKWTWRYGHRPRRRRRRRRKRRRWPTPAACCRADLAMKHVGQDRVLLWLNILTGNALTPNRRIGFVTAIQYLFICFYYYFVLYIYFLIK